GPISRADISAGTGLTRATVSTLVDQLVQGRLLVELEPSAQRRVGRPAGPLAAAPGTVLGLGLEVNVDYLGARVIDLAGRVLADRSELIDLRGSDPAEALGRLRVVAADALADAVAATDGTAQLAGACLALPGLVDRSS